MSFERADVLSRSRVPQFGRAVTAAAEEPFAVRRQSRCGNNICVSLEIVDHLAGLHVPQAQLFVPTGGDEPVAVVRNAHSSHAIDLCEETSLSAGVEVEGSRAKSRLGIRGPQARTSAPRRQPSAIFREGNRGYRARPSQEGMKFF